MKEIEVAAAIIEKDGLFLIARRSRNGTLPGLWEFPGGKIEPGESHRDALKRELAEELSVDADIGDAVAESSFEYPHGRVHLFGYRATFSEANPALAAHEEIRWVPLSRLREFDFAPADLPLISALEEKVR